jgi:D-glycero-alpha-D-manno-heptose-7-phosphate kinase
MKALILAGGFGTRLKSIAQDIPKPMVQIAGKPFLEHQIIFLKENGVTDIILAVHNMADKIKSYFKDGKNFGVRITYSEEETSLGTAGAIKKAQKYIDNSFIVLNGDSYSQVNLKELVEFHKSKMSNSTMTLTRVSDQSHYGNVILNEDKITSFSEKSQGQEGLVNSGVYIFEPKIFDYIPSEKNISLETEIFPKLAMEGELWGYFFKGYFMDIGRPETHDKFKRDVLGTLIWPPHKTIREALRQIEKSNVKLILILDREGKLLGVITDKIIRRAITEGANLEDPATKAMVGNPITALITDTKEHIVKLLGSGINQLPILDEQGRLVDVEFRTERIKDESFPTLRGKAPLRISFAGGGTDLQHFFEKNGGIVINATIDKYCYATIVKRADSKILINSDLGEEIILDSVEEMNYDGKFNLVKAIIKIMNPNFGFELYLYNDLPPGRGLGSSATLAVLAASLLSQLQGLNYSDHKLADIAYKAEREELKIKGGWQDQYAALTGGFSFMEFSKERTLIHPLRLKEDVVAELDQNLLLCYVGQSHSSGDQHSNQESKFVNNEEEITKVQIEHKRAAVDIKEALLTNNLPNIGRLLHESWLSKRELSSSISNPEIDRLYELGLQNGAYGGRLLGAGGGGYLLFYCPPKKRSQLTKALKNSGGEILNFNFEFGGTKVWNVRSNSI